MRGGYDRRMGIPVSILLIAAGAILAFAVTGHANGLNVHTVGWILMAAGLVGLVLSMIMWDSWAGGGFYTRRRRAVAYDAPPAAPVANRRVVQEDVVDEGPV
jgi:Domain of unknown function (DUF6458)